MLFKAAEKHRSTAYKVEVKCDADQKRCWKEGDKNNKVKLNLLMIGGQRGLLKKEKMFHSKQCERTN
jgi:hypothetical protein